MVVELDGTEVGWLIQLLLGFSCGDCDEVGQYCAVGSCGVPVAMVHDDSVDPRVDCFVMR